MSALSPRRRRPSHRAHLAERAWPWQPRRVGPCWSEALLFDEDDAYLDEDGDPTLTLRGLLKALVASSPERMRDPVDRARIVRLRERAASLRAALERAAELPDLGDMMIAGLGGEALRSAHDSGELVFYRHLDRELAARLV